MKRRIKLDIPIIVEGKYDKIRLSNIFDTEIITTEGFGIFKNTEKAEYIKRLAERKGIAVLTDSDAAGTVIRNRIKAILPTADIINVYLPPIFGKEPRKSTPSKEGLVGVEGTPDNVILEAFRKVGITIDAGTAATDDSSANNAADGSRAGDLPRGSASERGTRAVTRLDMYNAGLSGHTDSALKRDLLKKKLGLPSSLSQSALLEAINALYSYQEFLDAVEGL